MFKNSVLVQSGQSWKLYLAIIALLGGSIAPLFPESGISMTSGSVIAIVGYVFGLVAIRCSECGSMWFWEAAKDAGLYGAIFKKSCCPNCQHSYSKSSA
jgi:hypothetical protein